MTHSIWSLILLLVLCCNFKPAESSVSELELGALIQILEAFPDLRSVPSWMQKPDISSTLDYGGSWSSLNTSLCNGGEGFKVHGIHCSAANTIDALMITDAWGHPISTNFSEVSQLTFLSNFSNLATTVIGDELTKAILSSCRLKYIYAPIFDINTVTLKDPRIVIDLAVMASSFSLSNFSQSDLKKLELRGGSSMFESLNFNGFGLTTFIAHYIPISKINSSWTQGNIDRLELYNCIYDLEADFMISHSSIKHLVLQGGLNPSLGAPKLNIDASSLRTLSVLDIGMPLGSLNAGSLTDLVGSGWTVLPNTLPNLNLKTLRLMSSPTLALTPLSAKVFQSLESLALVGGILSNDELSSLLCDKIGNGNLKYLELAGVSNNNPVSRKIPECRYRMTQLVAVSLQGTDDNKFNTTSIFSNLPVHQVQELKVINAFDATVELSSFYGPIFPNLERLMVNDSNLLGPLPTTWTSIPNLVHIHLRSDALNGTIPATGWATLQSVSLKGSFTGWPVISDPAHALKALNIESGTLSEMPTDDTFSDVLDMQVLEAFQMATPSMGGPLPVFWINSTSISSVALENCAFVGAGLVQLATPRLRALNLANNLLCGTLPSIPIDIHPNVLDLSQNSFSGTIPDSWKSNLNLIEIINLASNFLNGSIPHELFEHHSKLRKVISLANNVELTGGLWNMSSDTDLEVLNISNTRIDVCSSEPGQGHYIMMCDFKDTQQCPTDCRGYNFGCGNVSCSRPNPSPIVAAPLCSTPTRVQPPSPPLSAPMVVPLGNSCPLPAPIGFACVNGAYLATGNVSVPTVTFPPGAGVVVVNGSFSSNGTVIFSGTGTTLDVRGCVEGLPTVELQLSGNEEPNKQLTLITQENGCSYDLKQTPVLTKDLKSGCKKSKVSTSSSTPSSLVVTLSFDSSGCNTKWIILGSVVGGVIVLAVIVVVLLTIFSSGFRDAVRPFYRRTRAAKTIE